LLRDPVYIREFDIFLGFDEEKFKFQSQNTNSHVAKLDLSGELALLQQSLVEKRIDMFEGGAAIPFAYFVYRTMRYIFESSFLHPLLDQDKLLQLRNLAVGNCEETNVNATISYPNIHCRPITSPAIYDQLHHIFQNFSVDGYTYSEKQLDSRGKSMNEPITRQKSKVYVRLDGTPSQ